MLKPWTQEKEDEEVAKAAAAQGKAEEAVKASLKENLAAELDVATPAPADPNAPELSKSQELISMYGDPSKDAPVLAIDNAPKPFKGLLASLDAGDEDMAFRYARQYVRHLRNLQERSEKVVSYTGLAMEREGLAGAEDWQTSPEFSKDREVLERNILQDAQKEKGDLSKTQNVSPQTILAKQLIARAEAEEAQGKPFAAENMPAAPANATNEQTERAKVRAVLARKVPRDASGAAEVYFFFNPTDPKAADMAQEIEKLQAQTKINPKLSVFGFTIRRPLGSEVASFKKRSKTSFSISNGEDYAKTLGVKNSPTTVVLSPTTGNALVEEGVRPFYYLDEAVKLAQGR